MKQKLLFLLLALLPSAMAWAAYGDEFTADGLIYVDYGDGQAILKGYATAPTGALVIPNVAVKTDTKETFNVVLIGPDAFKGCTGLTSVTIPYSIQIIGEDAFNGCTNVTDVYCWGLPSTMLYWYDDGEDDFKEDGSTRCHVRAYYLDDFKKSKSDHKHLFYPNVTFVGDEDEFTVGNLWYRVTDELVKEVEVINHVGEPTGVLNIPETVTHDGKIYSVTGIYDMSFVGCSGITRVIIPSRVRSIGTDAFNGCDGVMDIWCYALNPEWEEGDCDDFMENKATKCYVRPERLNWYKDTYSKSYDPDDTNVNVTFASLDYVTFVQDDITYVQTSSDEVMVYDSRNETTGNLEIPAKVKVYAVTSIGDYAFISCSATSVSDIPHHP